jgi:hypothetical protein
MLLRPVVLARRCASWAATVGLLIIGSACSEDLSAPGPAVALGVALGDGVPQVQAALGRSAIVGDMPAPFVNLPSPPIVKVVRDPTKGIDVVFDSSGKATQVDLFAPYAGQFHGVGLGTSRDEMLARLGEPHLTRDDASGDVSYRYFFKNTAAYVFFHVAATGGASKVKTISIESSAPVGILILNPKTRNPVTMVTR